MRNNRAFLSRAVEYLAGDAGIRQFLDIGAGIPSVDNTHEVAQRTDPQCKVLYVENDPIALRYGRALLDEQPAEGVEYLDADLRDPGTLLDEAAEKLDLAEPVAVMLLSVLHCIPDADDPAAIVATILDAVPTGSYLAISHPATDIHAAQMAAGSKVMATKRMNPSITFRPREQVLGFFNGLPLLPPGLVAHSRWRPRPGADTSRYSSWAGVARK